MPTPYVLNVLNATRQYVNAWGSPPDHDLQARLEKIMAPGGVLFKADSVVHLEDRKKTAADLAAHIRERHAAYRHMLHRVFAMAANDTGCVVFVGVRFKLENIGPVAGHPATGKISGGVLLEQLTFDEDARIATALVCRQMTEEEIACLIRHPDSVKPPILDYEFLTKPEEKLSEADIATMRRSVERWVHCWDTDADLSVLPEVLSPDVLQLSAYGLGKHRVPFRGVSGAVTEISHLMTSLDNTNTIEALAICPDRRAGFVHWRAHALHTTSRVPEGLEALDYLHFDAAGRIAFLFSFTMRPYKQVREHAPRGAGID